MYLILNKLIYFPIIAFIYIIQNKYLYDRLQKILKNSLIFEFREIKLYFHFLYTSIKIF